MHAHSLYEGSFSVDTTKKFIPFDPAIHDRKDRPGSLFIHVHPFLIESANGLILLDTGLGFTNADGGLLLHDNMRKKGFDPADVRYVLQSHLHKDHASGMVTEQDGSLRLAFPEAEYVIQRGEWEDAYSGKSDSYRTEIFDVLQRSGNLLLVEGDGVVNNEIRYEQSGGHTAHHQVSISKPAASIFSSGGMKHPNPNSSSVALPPSTTTMAARRWSCAPNTGNKAPRKVGSSCFTTRQTSPLGGLSKSPTAATVSWMRRSDPAEGYGKAILAVRPFGRRPDLQKGVASVPAEGNGIQKRRSSFGAARLLAKCAVRAYRAKG